MLFRSTVAMSHAKKDATAKAEKSALVKQAQDNTSAIIKSVLSGIASPSSEDYKVDVKVI